MHSYIQNATTKNPLNCTHDTISHVMSNREEERGCDSRTAAKTSTPVIKGLLIYGSHPLADMFVVAKLIKTIEFVLSYLVICMRS